MFQADTNIEKQTVLLELPVCFFSADFLLQIVRIRNPTKRKMFAGFFMIAAEGKAGFIRFGIQTACMNGCIRNGEAFQDPDIHRLMIGKRAVAF